MRDNQNLDPSDELRWMRAYLVKAQSEWDERKQGLLGEIADLKMMGDIEAARTCQKNYKKEIAHLEKRLVAYEESLRGTTDAKSPPPESKSRPEPKPPEGPPNILAREGRKWIKKPEQSPPPPSIEWRTANG